MPPEPDKDQRRCKRPKSAGAVEASVLPPTPPRAAGAIVRGGDEERLFPPGRRSWLLLALRLLRLLRLSRCRWPPLPPSGLGEGCEMSSAFAAAIAGLASANSEGPSGLPRRTTAGLFRLVVFGAGASADFLKWGAAAAYEGGSSAEIPNAVSEEATPLRLLRLVPPPPTWCECGADARPLGEQALPVAPVAACRS